MSKIDLLLPTDLTMVSATFRAGADQPAVQAGNFRQWWLPWRKRGRRRWWRQRQWYGGSGNRGSVCTADTLAVSSGNIEEVVARWWKEQGQWFQRRRQWRWRRQTNSGNGGAGNDSGNRGSGGATTINQPKRGSGRGKNGGCGGGWRF